MGIVRSSKKSNRRRQHAYSGLHALPHRRSCRRRRILQATGRLLDRRSVRSDHCAGQESPQRTTFTACIDDEWMVDTIDRVEPTAYRAPTQKWGHG